MQRVSTPTAAATLPSVVDISTPGYFTEGDPTTGTPATEIGQDWMNDVQEELIAILTAAGITPAIGTRNQVLTSIFSLIASGYQSATRIRLTSNLTLYVNESTGNNSNSGLSSGQAFKTLQHAWNIIVDNYDLGRFTVTIQNGANVTMGGIVATTQPVDGLGSVVVDGGGFSIAITNGTCFGAFNGASFTVQNWSGTSASGTGVGQGTIIIASGGGSNITVGANMTIGIGALYDFRAQFGGQIGFSNNYTISSGAHVIHWSYAYGGLIYANGVAITLSGTPSCSSEWANGEDNSTALIACTFTGSGTGTTALIEMNATLDTGGALNLPGNGTYTLNSGGQKR